MDKIVLNNITKSFGKNAPVIEDLNLHIREHSFTVLLGPSGCGKSTILRMIAGLEKADSGEILIDGASMEGVEPGDRQIAMVFQNYALYPTMNVKDNIEFGLKNMKVEKEERDRRIREVARMVNLEEYLERMPSQLSGGQRQRVALARAIVKKPAVFLMDEPLSNLDAKLRASIRTELVELHRKLNSTFVYVTHDQVEAMSMGSDIVLLDKGKIQQYDSPSRLYGRPSNLFSAQFIGSPPMNILPCVQIRKADQEMDCPQNASHVGFRPESAAICPVGQRSGKEIRPAGQKTGKGIYLEGNLVARELLGDHILYNVRTECGDIRVKDFSKTIMEYGEVSVAAEKEKLYFFDENGCLLQTAKEEA